jgi:hypothetical protein
LNEPVGRNRRAFDNTRKLPSAAAADALDLRVQQSVAIFRRGLDVIVIAVAAPARELHPMHAMTGKAVGKSNAVETAMTAARIG